MEKRLRSSLKCSSAEEFLSAVTCLSLKSSKASLKSLIHSIPPSSPLSSSLPPSLHDVVSASILSFQNLLEQHRPQPSSPSQSPPSKRLRRSSRQNPPSANNNNNISRDNDPRKYIEKLRILAHVTFLCLSHPKKTFLPSHLLPAAQSLHDNLIAFESDFDLLTEITNLCEEFWKGNVPGREVLISQSLPVLISRSLTLKRKADVHRVYLLREAFALFDFEDDSIEDLKVLLIRCALSPLFLKTEDGRRFVAFVIGLSGQLLKEVLAVIRSQIPFGRKSMLEAYGEVVFRAWKCAEGGLKDDVEIGFLQGLIEGAVHARSGAFAASIRRVLGGFVSQRISEGVEKLLFRLAEPVMFRSLQVANSNVRLNALHLLLDLFPLEDPDSTKEVKDSLLDKQFFLLERLLVDDCPDVRGVAVEGCCRVLHLFWEIIPSSTILKLLTKIFDDMSHDACNEVRLSTVNGIVYLLGNPQSHEILKVLLPRLGHLISDTVVSVRAAVMDLLLLIRDIRSFQFHKVVSLDLLLSTLANDHSQVAQKVTRLLIPSYFPSKVGMEEACNRCVTLIKRSPIAGSRFCEFAALEGASLKSLMELVKELIRMVLSQDKLDMDQIEGFLLAAAYLCNNLVSEPSYRNALKDLFAGGKGKCLLATASTGRAKTSVLSMLSVVSSENADAIVEECMRCITNCRGLLDNLEVQAELRSAHKLLLSCDCFDDMIDVLTRLLQKTAYRCHIKFGTEMPKQRVSSGKRKKGKSSFKSSVKWKHVSGKNAVDFEEDYSIAVGIAWQIKDLLASEDTRKAMLGSQSLGLAFLALKVLSEASIEHCICFGYMDISPVLAYTDLALHITLQNICISSGNDCGTKKHRTNSSTSSSEQTVLDQTIDHLINCVENLLGAVELGGKQKKDHRHGEKHKKLQGNACSSNDDGALCTEEKRMSKMVKILTTVLKYIVDSTSMGLLSHFHQRCLKFTSAYLKLTSIALGKQSKEESLSKDDELKDIILCLKSSLSYGAKLLNLILRDASESSPPPSETFDLANDMLDLITSTELHLGSGFTARLVSAVKSWLPDLILALGSGCILQQPQAESAHLTASYNIKHHSPSWPSILAITELHQTSGNSSEDEDDSVSETDAFPVFKNFMEMMVSQLKGNPKILDAVGVIFLSISLVGLERKDFDMVLGLLHFVCVKLVGQEDREWSELNMMLTSLPDIYPDIEREIDEQDDEVVIKKLHSARALLEPVWLYHVYETGRFSMMEE